MTAVEARSGPEAAPHTRHRRWASGVLALLGVLGVVLAAVPPVDGPLAVVRAVSTTAFLLLGPGWAVAGFLRAPAPALAWALAAGVGCAVGGIGGQAMLTAGAWHPVAAMVVLAAVCVPVLVRHAVRAR